MGRAKWGDEGYAREELVAELGSAFLCADLAVTPEVREDHAAYIASWLKVLKDDKRLIVSAAIPAQRAVDYLHGLQPKAEIYGCEAAWEPPLCRHFRGVRPCWAAMERAPCGRSRTYPGIVGRHADSP